MSRSGYSDDCDDVLALGRWRGRVESALRGKRGQAMLRDLIAGLDAMPEKKLIAGKLTGEDGCHCALGVVAERRGIDTAPIDFEEDEETFGFMSESVEPVAKALNIPVSLACEVMFINDELDYGISPEERWRVVRAWAVRQLKEDDHG